MENNYSFYNTLEKTEQMGELRYVQGKNHIKLLSRGMVMFKCNSSLTH